MTSVFIAGTTKSRRYTTGARRGASSVGRSEDRHEDQDDDEHSPSHPRTPFIPPKGGWPGIMVGGIIGRGGAPSIAGGGAIGIPCPPDIMRLSNISRIIASFAGSIWGGGAIEGTTAPPEGSGIIGIPGSIRDISFHEVRAARPGPKSRVRARAGGTGHGSAGRAVSPPAGPFPRPPASGGPASRPSPATPRAPRAPAGSL